MNMQLRKLLLAFAILATGTVDACNLSQNRISVPDFTPVGTIVVQELVASPGILNAAATNSDSQNDISPLQALSNNSIVLRSKLTQSGIFRVQCTDGFNQLLFVTMIDTDNNAPVWDSSSYSVSVSETQAVPYILPINPKASDEPDKNSGQKLEYRIVPSDYSTYFSLLSPLQSVMNITLVRQLDYETVQRIVLTLQVLDYNSTGQLLFVVNATLTVNVINENDENPVWLNCTPGAPPGVCYLRQLLSNSTIGTLVAPPVKAVDGNLGLNLPIFYELLSQSPSNIVSLDNTTGALSLTSNLPLPETYRIVLFALQVGNVNKKTNTEVRLTIFPSVYTPPVFNKALYNQTVMENNIPGLVVVVVEASDQLRKGVAYALQGYQTVFTLRSIGPSAELKVIGQLDYESQSSYIFNITASDGTGIGYATVLVTVENVNEFNPAFNQTEYKFAAVKRENGLEVGVVKATDDDRIPVNYYITDADYAKLFSVNSTSGIVRINTVPANLVEQNYRFSVTATDGSRTGATTVTVTFDSALINVATASVTTISLIVLGCVFAVIILAAIAAFFIYRCNAAKQKAVEEGSEAPGSYNYGDLYEIGSTSQQDNPVEGYNNYMFGEDGGPDAGVFYRERDQGELFVSNGFYPAESILTNGSIHTASGRSSVVGSQRTLVQGSRARQLHTSSNLQVVQVENAVDASSELPAGDGPVRPGLTVYF